MGRRLIRWNEMFALAPAAMVRGAVNPAQSHRILTDRILDGRRAAHRQPHAALS
jgi:hypothetical protein